MSPPVTTPRAPMAPAGASTETLALTTGGAGSGPERRAYDLDATQVGPRTMAAGPVSSANWSEPVIVTSRPPEVDSTIILPLSHKRWNGNETEQSQGKS